MEKKPGLGKSTFWYSVGNIFSRSVGIVLLPFYSNFINTEDFGVYSLLMAIYAFASVFYQSSLQNSLLKFYSEADQPDMKRIIFSSTLNVIAVLGIFLTAAGIIFSAQFSDLVLGSKIHSRLVSIVFIILLIDNISFFYLQLLKTEERSGYASGLVIISSILNLILNILFVFIMRRGIEGILIAQLISGAVLVLIIVKPLFKLYLPVIDKQILSNSVRFAFPLVVAGLLTSAVDFIDRFIIDAFLGREEVGIYSFSYRIALVMNLFVISLRSAWIPYVLRVSGNPESPLLLGKSFTKILSVCALIFLAVTLFTEDIFNLRIEGFDFINPEYKPGMDIIPLILISYTFSSLLTFYSAAPFITGKSYDFLYADLTGFLLNIIFNFILIPQIGITGAAAATLISYAGSAFHMYLISAKVIRIRYQTGKILFLIGLTTAIYLLTGFYKSLVTDVILFLTALVFIYRSAELNYKTLFG
ncbi:MAG: oligosaccharide flippase family protein [Ignavibacteriaceae bacterium]